MPDADRPAPEPLTPERLHSLMSSLRVRDDYQTRLLNPEEYDLIGNALSSLAAERAARDGGLRDGEPDQHDVEWLAQTLYEHRDLMHHNLPGDLWPLARRLLVQNAELRRSAGWLIEAALAAPALDAETMRDYRRWGYAAGFGAALADARREVEALPSLYRGEMGPGRRVTVTAVLSALARLSGAAPREGDHE